MKQLIYASLLLLASCTQEGDNIPGTDDRVPLAVNTVSIVADGTNPDTRATVLPMPVTNGKLWVGIRAKNGYTAQTGLVYTYGSGAWTTSAASVMLGKDPISLYAYYPQDGYSIDAYGSITLVTQPYNAAKDLGYATSGGENVCATHPYAGFVLKHAYARVKVDISFSPLFADATVLDAVSVTAGGITQEGTLDLETGVIGEDATKQPELKWTPGITLGSAVDRKYIGEMLVVYSSVVTDAKLSVTIDGSNWTADLSGALTTLQAGKSYRIKVIMGSALIIDKVEVEDWTTGTAQNGDTQFE